MLDKQDSSIVRNILISRLNHKRTLFLHNPDEIGIDTFMHFLQSGLDNGGFSVYFSTGFINKEFKRRFNQIQPRSRCSILSVYGSSHIRRELSNLLKKSRYRVLHVIVDYNATSLMEHNDIIRIERMLSKMKDFSSGISIMSSLNPSSLDNKTLTEILGFHDQIMVNTNDNGVITLIGSKDAISHEPVKIISAKILERSVKDNLRVLILSILSGRETSGYEIIKAVERKFKVRLSPGTIYPLLYSLQEEGLIEIKDNTGNAKRKNYGPTENGRNLIEKEIMEFRTVKGYLSEFMGGGLKNLIKF